ncbi:YdeI family protein [Lysobacter sp. TAF61]|uniref:YdeI/OmpD-associated family protein n=1 Tax=Lysobacter sp. TAF61 TaxID=3233072 RepID=UPI003F982BCE
MAAQLPTDLQIELFRDAAAWEKWLVAHAEGRMQAGGLREVEAARADGRWQAAYHAASGMEVPPELAAALAGNARARRFFEQLDGTNRYAFCWRVHTAKKPETRIARAEKFVEMLARDDGSTSGMTAVLQASSI